MINNVVLVGRIANDLELRTTANGHKFVKFTLAFDAERSWEDTNFMPCVAWSEQAEKMCEFLAKGSLVGIQGGLSVRNFEHNGEKRTSIEVVARAVKFMESKKASEANVSAPAASKPTLSNPQPVAKPVAQPKPTTTSAKEESEDSTIDWLDSFL